MAAAAGDRQRRPWTAGSRDGATAARRPPTTHTTRGGGRSAAVGLRPPEGRPPPPARWPQQRGAHFQLQKPSGGGGRPTECGSPPSPPRHRTDSPVNTPPPCLELGTDSICCSGPTGPSVLSHPLGRAAPIRLQKCSVSCRPRRGRLANGERRQREQTTKRIGSLRWRGCARGCASDSANRLGTNSSAEDQRGGCGDADSAHALVFRQGRGMV